MARALAWHARGRRFDPDTLHKGLLLVSLLYFMPFYVYIIYSPSLDQFYIGHTQNLEDRLFRHNNSGSKSTKKAHDWALKYTEEFSTRAEAASRELQIKNRKSRNYIETLNGSPDGYRDG